jgi:hypothetical protein
MDSHEQDYRHGTLLNVTHGEIAICTTARTMCLHLMHDHHLVGFYLNVPVAVHRGAPPSPEHSSPTHVTSQMTALFTFGNCVGMLPLCEVWPPDRSLEFHAYTT